MSKISHSTARDSEKFLSPKTLKKEKNMLSLKKQEKSIIIAEAS